MIAGHAGLGGANGLLLNLLADTIVLNTTECSPLESFAKEDIELWAVMDTKVTEPDSHGDGVDLRYSIVPVACHFLEALMLTLLSSTFSYQRVDRDRPQTSYQVAPAQTRQSAAGRTAGGTAAANHQILQNICRMLRRSVAYLL